MLLPKKSFHVAGGEFNAIMMPALLKKKIKIFLAFDTREPILKIFTVVTKLSTSLTLKSRDAFLNSKNLRLFLESFKKLNIFK